MIAALGNFDIGEMPGREPESRRRVVRDILRARGDLEQGQGRDAPGSVFRVARCVIFMAVSPVLIQFRQPSNDFLLLTPGSWLLTPGS